MAHIRLEQLTKDFPGNRGQPVRALKDLSLAVEEKELLALLGPSGSGKTTVLRLIAGLEEPTAGAVYIDGKDMRGLPPKARNVAMVFQHPALYPHMSVFENMAFGLKLRGVPQAETRIRVQQTAEMLGLTGCLERQPEGLSGGQLQRVALGRALVRRPKVFLLDEPLSNLDAGTRGQLRNEICRLQQESGSTMIYVTHDQQEASALGNRVAVLNEGALQQIDIPLAIYRNPANRFVAGFVGSPPMNFFPGKLARNGPVIWFEASPETPASGQGLRLRLQDLAESLPEATGRNVLLGIRPEDIRRCASASQSADGNTIEAVVERAEATGPESYIHFRTGRLRFVARELLSAGMAKPGEKTTVCFLPERAHIFDARTGVRLGQPGRTGHATV